MNITDELIKCIKEEKPITFAKFGDGEYMCASGVQGKNCDGTPYDADLAQGLKTGIRLINTMGGYCGLWDEPHIKHFWEDIVGGEVNWAHYHSAIVDRHDWQKKVELYKTIQESKLNKIFVRNDLLQKVDLLLGAKGVEIGRRRWYRESYERVKKEIKEKMEEGINIVMTSGGMGTKVLIGELMLEREGIYIDIGSALDLIGTKKDSRGYMKYEEMEGYFKEILPKTWEDEKYNELYKQAQQELGIHL